MRSFYDGEHNPTFDMISTITGRKSEIPFDPGHAILHLHTQDSRAKVLYLGDEESSAVLYSKILSSDLRT